MITGQTRRDFSPCLSAVGRFMNAAARPTVDQDPNVTSSLIARGNDDIGISGVDHEFVDAGVFINAQERFPGASAIRRAV